MESCFKWERDAAAAAVSDVVEKKTNVEEDDDGAKKEDQQPQPGKGMPSNEVTHESRFPPERIAELIEYTMAGKDQMNDIIPTSPDNNHNKVTNF